MIPTTNKLLAFPTSLRAEAATIVNSLSKNQLPSSGYSFQVRLQGESLEIPYRVYYQENKLLKCIQQTNNLGIIALCLGTRHCNGFVRELCLRQLINRKEYWVIPFVVQLIGEYILPILQFILQELLHLDKEQYREFYIENTAYFETIQRRVISYWNVYYRGSYPKWSEYPGYQLLQALPFDIQNTHFPEKNIK